MSDQRLLDVINQVGTPAYVYDSRIMAEKLTALQNALPQDSAILYSLKANPHPDVVQFFVNRGCWMDVCSLGEAEVVLAAGCPPERVLFLGPGKRPEELRFCVDQKLGVVVVESLPELAQLSELATAANTTMQVLLRVNPSFESKNSRLSMGGKPRQFGIDQEILSAAAPSEIHLPGIDVVGFHCYMGTRNLSAQSIAENTSAALQAFTDLAKTLDVNQRMADVGGGFGVPYFDKEEPLDVVELQNQLAQAVTEFKWAHPECLLMFESGRYLMGDAGAYLVKVLYKKTSRGKTFLVCDGGTNHHMAAVGIGSFVKRNFPGRVLGKTANPEVVDVCGPLCTPNDTIFTKITLADPQVGDVIAVERSGAYGVSASPGAFLSHPAPQEVLI